MVFVGGAFGRLFGLRVKLLYPLEKINAFREKIQDRWALFSPSHVRIEWEDGCYKPRRESSSEASHAGTLASDFQPPALWEINVCGLFVCLFVYLFKIFYLFMRDTERQGHRQREKQAPCGEPDTELHSRTRGSQSEPKADTQPLSHPGAPNCLWFKSPRLGISSQQSNWNTPKSNSQ